MWFKNLQLYRLNGPFDLSPEQLHEQLLTRQSRACGALESATLGWDRPLGREGSLLTHAAGNCIMLCARREEKVLPAAVVREQLGEKIAQLEEAEGRKIRRREKEELKDGIMLELLPQAFSKSTRVFAYIDQRNGWLVVDAVSAKRAEELIGLLRETLGSFPVTPLEVVQSPAAVMTGWLEGQPLPVEFQLGDECELRDPMEDGGIVRCRRQDLTGDEIKAHLKAGKQLVRVALEWHERLALVLAEDLSIRRLKFLDVIQEEAAEAEAEDAVTRFDVDFALMSLELGRFIPRLLELFGGMAAEQG